MKKKAEIHLKPEEKLASNTERVVSAVQEGNSKLSEVNSSLKALTETNKDKSIEMTGFSGVIKSVQKNTNKLDEVKSAGIATNITLKKIEKTISGTPQRFSKFPEIKPTDMSETNRLLKEIASKEAPAFPTIPDPKDVDFTATNKLLQQLLEKEDKDVDISVSLKIV